MREHLVRLLAERNNSLEVLDESERTSPEKLTEIQTHRTGAGTRGMRERVVQFACGWNIQSDGSGTRISITLPLTNAVTPIA